MTIFFNVVNGERVRNVYILNVNECRIHGISGMHVGESTLKNTVQLLTVITQ